MREAAEHTAGWRKVAEFLALRRNITLLLAALVLAGTGERLWLGFAPKYLEVLGAGVLIIGCFDALQTLLGAVYAYPGGWLTDRLGQRRSLLLFTGLALAGYLLVLVWRHWLAVLAGSFLFLAWSALSLPATFTVVATSLAAHRHTMGIGVQSMVRRVPMMVGPLVGGWLITRFGWDLGVRYALLGCIGLGAATALFQWFMSEPQAEAPPGAPGALGFRAVVKSFTPQLRELLLSDILIRFCERIPYAWVVLWGRTGPQGHDHRGGLAGLAVAHLRGLLPHPGLHGHHRVVRGGVAVAGGAEGELRGGGLVRGRGHAVVLAGGFAAAGVNSTHVAALVRVPLKCGFLTKAATGYGEPCGSLTGAQRGRRLTLA